MQQDAEIFYTSGSFLFSCSHKGTVYMDMPGNFAFPHLVAHKVQFPNRMYYISCSQEHSSNCLKLLQSSSSFTYHQL